MKKFLTIRTASGMLYLVNEKMEITQRDNNRTPSQHAFSGQWIFKGIVTARYGNNLITAKQLFDTNIIDDINFTFKNCSSRYTVLDIDHGTTRLWTDGVRAITKVK